MTKCVLCGKELGVLGRGHILFYGVEQPVCADCKKRYDQSERKDWLCQRMLQSRDLRDREFIEQSIRLDQEREELKRRQAERKRRSKDTVQCCGRPMTFLKTTCLLTERENLLSQWSYLPQVCVFRCEECGQVKFYDPSFLE